MKTKNIVARPHSENKNKVATFRLTETELADVREIKNELSFSSDRALFVYGLEIIRRLREWKRKGLRFYVGKSQAGANEVEFDL